MRFLREAKAAGKAMVRGVEVANTTSPPSSAALRAALDEKERKDLMRLAVPMWLL
jgi:hypothetical protein